MNEIVTKLSKIIKGQKTGKLSVYLIFFGALILCLNSIKTNTKESQIFQKPKEETKSIQKTDPDDKYRLDMENELTIVLEEIEGKGNVKVMISLLESKEVVYTGSKNTANDIIKSYYPKIGGVVVVIRNKNSEKELQITQAIQALFHLEPHRIKVLMKE